MLQPGFQVVQPVPRGRFRVFAIRARLAQFAQVDRVVRATCAVRVTCT
jgi:hypothetical protein